MISLIEALNYRCLRHIRQPMESFHVLVGPNASGKTTFLDVVSFLGDLVSLGLEKTVSKRSPNFEDLLFGRQGNKIELAIEARIPEKFSHKIREKTGGGRYDTIRYEVMIGLSEENEELEIRHEAVLFKTADEISPGRRTLFPHAKLPVDNTICTVKQSGVRGQSTILKKSRNGNDNFYDEIYKDPGKGWASAFKLGTKKSTLANLPEDESKFPVATWLKRFLTEGNQNIVLDSLKMRHASPPGKGRKFRSDGSNLPWVIENLKKSNPDRFRDWIDHLQTALPDLTDVETIEREDDKHRYLVLIYRDNLRVPSWTASDGTLRLLALTLPAYLSDIDGLYLIEEPENGIHPKAVETMYQSLSHVYDSQVLMATHSPVILSIAEPEAVLCFAKDEEGATDIVRGSEHPSLSDWQGETNLGTLFAAGVLG